MADISMCMNEECLSRNVCYRYKAERSVPQWWFDFKPKDGEEKCEDFWPINNDDKNKKKRRAWHY